VLAVRARSGGEPSDDQDGAKPDQREGGDLLGSFTQALADMGAKMKPELGSEERLDGDGRDDRHNWQAGQAKAEAAETAKESNPRGSTNASSLSIPPRLVPGYVLISADSPGLQAATDGGRLDRRHGASLPRVAGQCSLRLPMLSDPSVTPRLPGGSDFCSASRT
jgi:hypothetical protein